MHRVRNINQLSKEKQSSSSPTSQLPFLDTFPKARISMVSSFLQKVSSIWLYHFLPQTLWIDFPVWGDKDFILLFGGKFWPLSWTKVRVLRCWELAALLWNSVQAAPTLRLFQATERLLWWGQRWQVQTHKQPSHRHWLLLFPSGNCSGRPRPRGM